MARNVDTLPTFIVIGAKKCGTTSLHYYLSLHPEISVSRTKELNFFVKEYNWDRGEAWYRAQFDGHYAMRGESSPNYSRHPEYVGVPLRMHRLIPDVKLIYLVRDPIDRLISDYVHDVASGRLTCTLEKTLETYPHYLNRSRYFMQISRFLEFFPREQLLIISTEGLAMNRRQQMAKILNFLGVRSDFYSFRFNFRLHSSKLKRHPGQGLFQQELVPGSNLFQMISPHLSSLYSKLVRIPFNKPITRPVLQQATRQRLLDELADDIRQLQDFSGLSLKEWSF
jgi:hypothetical protein